MARVRLSDPSLIDEFVAFLARSGFVVEPEDAETVRLDLPLTPGPARTPEDIRVLLEVWLEIGLRIWHDLWPDAGALVLAEPAAPEPAVDLLAS